MDQNHLVGTIFGAIIGVIKAVAFIISSTFIMISWEQVFDTGTLALIGGALGWCGAELMKWIKKLSNRKK